MTAPTATRRTWKTRPRTTHTRRTWRLPHLGWTATFILVAIACANTWPIQTGLLTGLIAAVGIIVVVRPRRLAPLLNPVEELAAAISARRSHLPAPGNRTLAAFQRMDPYQFEKAIAALAREDRHRVSHAEQVGQANDRGADVIVKLRDGRRILIQCKKYRDGNNVGSQTVQTINGVYRDIHHCQQAVIVTTSSFTDDAYRTNGLLPKPILLLNGHQLVQWANGGHAPW